MTTRACGEYSSSSKKSDSMSKKWVSSAWICACSRSFATFSFFGQFFAKCPGLLHTKQTFEVFPLNYFLRRNFQFFIFKNLFFWLAWCFSSRNISWNDLFFLLDMNNSSHNTLFANPSFCNYLWVCYEPCLFLKEIFSDCRVFLGQWEHAGKYLPRRLVARLFSGDSSCEVSHPLMVLEGTWGRYVWRWHHPYH